MSPRLRSQGLESTLCCPFSTCSLDEDVVPVAILNLMGEIL